MAHTLASFSLTFSLPDTTNFNWNTAYNFRVAATNICGTSYSAIYPFTIRSTPAALSTPTLTTVYENYFRIDWTALNTDAERGYSTITAYELSYCLSSTCPSPTVTTSPYTPMTETSNLYYE